MCVYTILQKWTIATKATQHHKTNEKPDYVSLHLPLGVRRQRNAGYKKVVRSQKHVPVVMVSVDVKHHA